MKNKVNRIEAVSLEVILPLRTEVLRDGQPPESAQFEGDHAPTTLHLAAYHENDPIIGCVSLMHRPMPADPTRTHQLRGMAVAEPWRSRGVGALLLAELQQRTPEFRVWCNARVPAQRFYERHGWRVVSEVFVIPHHGPHVRMVRG
ncbi:MAG: GNAT family N-acetyltransferase [Planctomycetota bacterium]